MMYYFSLATNNACKSIILCLFLLVVFTFVYISYGKINLFFIV